MADPYFDDILSDKALRYRRNVLVLALIVIAIIKLPGLDFNNLNFFGVRLDADPDNPLKVVLYVLWFLLAYNLCLFFYYAYEAWENWAFAVSRQHPIGKREAFPQARLFIGWPPSKKATATRKQLNDPHIKDAKWRFVEADGTSTWLLHFVKKDDTLTEWFNAHVLPTGEVRSARRKIRMFAVVDLGLPIVLTLAALVFSYLEFFPQSPDAS